MAHKAYFFAAGATQKRTLHSRYVVFHAGSVLQINKQ